MEKMASLSGGGLGASLVLSRSSAASTQLWCPCFLWGEQSRIRTKVSPFGCPVSTFSDQAQLYDGGVLSESPALSRTSYEGDSSAQGLCVSSR